MYPQSIKKIEGHFLLPSVCPVPSVRPVTTRRSAARRKLSTGPRRDIVVASTLWLLSRLVAVEVAEAQWQLYSFWSKYRKRLVPPRQKPTGCYTLSGAIITSA